MKNTEDQNIEIGSRYMTGAYNGRNSEICGRFFIMFTRKYTMPEWGGLKHAFIGISFLLLFVSCIKTVSNRNDLKEKINAVLTLEEDAKGEKIFELDSESVQLNRCVQLVSFGDSVYYTFFNEYNKSIYFYDYSTGVFRYKIGLETEGANGVYPYRSGYYIAAPDSIYFYSLKTHFVYLLNKKGEKLHTFDYRGSYINELKDLDLDALKNKIIPPTIRVTTEQPVYNIGEKIYLCGDVRENLGRTDSINNLIITSIDTKNNKTEYNVGYPASYRDGNWGDNFYKQVFWGYDDAKKVFLISFPNDHYIYSCRTDFKDFRKIYAGSMYAGDIKSLGYPSAIPLSDNIVNTHYFEQYYYRAIIYDKYRNVYYRIVEHPWKNYNSNMNIRDWLKPLSIIILDSDFNVVGEKILDMEYHLSYYNYFITEEGLFLNKKNDDEDKLTYSLFVIKEIKAD
jgi:hypothetical protein